MNVEELAVALEELIYEIQQEIEWLETTEGDSIECIGVVPHTSFKEAAKYNVAPGDWYEFVEIPYCHWSGLFMKIEYDEQLEELEQIYNGK
jgi:hypothetical protein